jgi:flagellar biosynthesis/type III secretory pathway chaperone
MHSDARQRLEVVLDRELGVAQQLNATLEAERTALTGTSSEDVVAHAAEKIALFADIERLEKERRALCTAAGVELARDSGGLDGISTRWRSLLEAMSRCHAANEINGYIINVRRNQIGQLIDVLRGGAPATYGPNGKTFAKALRALAQA